MSFMKEILLMLVWTRLMCLIPKKENAVKVKDFRLISLVTSVYKMRC